MSKRKVRLAQSYDSSILDTGRILNRDYSGIATPTNELMRNLEGFVGRKKQKDRLAYAHELLEDAGYEVYGQKRFFKSYNAYAFKKGRTDNLVIVGAHYDKAEKKRRERKGDGIIDNASGVVELAGLAKSLRNVDTHNSYMFVAFEDEEKGLWGSQECVKWLKKKGDLDKTRYMINVDGVGCGRTSILRDLSNTSLADAASRIADYKGIAVKESCIDECSVESRFLKRKITRGGDHSSFINKGIPTLTFTSENEPKYAHSPEDKIDKINPTELYNTQELLLGTVIAVEEQDCKQAPST